jgi:DNA polymerase III epsilon subunit-like protein
MKLLVVDTETGGLNHELFSCLEVGLVAWEDGIITETDDFYVYEGEEWFCVDSDALDVNGIDPEKVIDEGINCDAAIDRLRAISLRMNDGDAAAHTRLAGWNLGFDKRFLLRLYKIACGETNETFSLPPYFSHRGFDVPSIMFALAHVGAIDMAPHQVNSSNAFDYFGVQPPDPQRHTALGDAVATAHLITKVMDKLRSATWI